MKYVEIARGIPHNRGIIIPAETLVNYIDKAPYTNPLYRSVYLYDNSAKEYVEQNGSLRDFFGIRYIDKVPIDIDKRDNTDEKTLDILRGTILELEEADIGCESFQSYFSGSGYHLILTASLFEFKPGIDLPYIVKQTCKKLFPQIDSSIYMRTGIYRVQHTVNHKTGLYKIPLTRDEVMNLDASDILEMAKENFREHSNLDLPMEKREFRKFPVRNIKKQKITKRNKRKNEQKEGQRKEKEEQEHNKNRK